MKPKYLTLIPATAAVLLLSGCDYLREKPKRFMVFKLDGVGSLSCTKEKEESILSHLPDIIDKMDTKGLRNNTENQQMFYVSFCLRCLGPLYWPMREKLGQH